MKEKILSWGLPILLVIAGGILAFRYLPGAHDPQTQTPSQEQREGQKSFAGEEEELSPEQNLRKALETGNLSLCAKLPDEAARMSCEDQISYKKIINSGDLSQCEQLNDQTLQQRCRDTYYLLEGIRTQNRQLCDRIQDKSIQLRCLDEILAQSATASKADCEQVSNPKLKQECLDKASLNQALQEQNPESCEQIGSQMLKEQCLTTLSGNQQVLQKSQELATSVPDSTEGKLLQCDALSGALAQKCKDDANYSLAFEKRDLSFCQKITLPADRQTCMEQQGDAIDQFYLRKAVSTKNPSDCAPIANQELKALCQTSSQS